MILNILKPKIIAEVFCLTEEPAAIALICSYILTINFEYSFTIDILTVIEMIDKNEAAASMWVYDIYDIEYKAITNVIQLFIHSHIFMLDVIWIDTWNISYRLYFIYIMHSYINLYLR